MKGDDFKLLEELKAGESGPVQTKPGVLRKAHVWLSLVIVLVVYFLLQAISRGLISETLGMDDAEQSVLAQKWSWGYGPQPPFYTWLVIIFSKVFGLSSFTMALLKNALLFGIYTLTYFVARRVTGSHLMSIAAAVALQFMPSIAYEAHRELTHSILASLMVLLTLFFFLRLRQGEGCSVSSVEEGITRRASLAPWPAYILLGVLGGLGMLSKYNYSIFYIAVIIAALWTKTWRPVILNLRAATALVVTLLIVAPNLLWIKNHPELALSSMRRIDIEFAHRGQSQLWVVLDLQKIRRHNEQRNNQ